MTRILTILLLFIATLTARAQMNSWQSYPAYGNIQQIVKGRQMLYVRASDGLYSYNLNDQSITTFSKTDVLSDCNISFIAWNQQTSKLVIIYANSNIDLLSPSGEVTNISSLYMKSMLQSKTVRAIAIHGKYVLLATNFGFVKLDTDREEITESCVLDQALIQIGVSGKYIYARRNDGRVLQALLTANLINPASWTLATSWDTECLKPDLTDYNEYISLVKTLKPGGPHYNHFNTLSFDQQNRRLLSSGGGWRQGARFNRPVCAQIYQLDDDTWTVIDSLKPLNATMFTDATSIAADPSDPNHIFLSTCGAGLFELRDGKLIANYTDTNSPLKSALADDDDNVHNYVRTDGLVFDDYGCLWMVSSPEASKKNSVLRLNTRTGEWTEYNDKNLYDDNGNILYIMRRTKKAPDGTLWLVNDHSVNPCLLHIDPVKETFTRYDTYINQDGTLYTLYNYRDLAIDLDGNIWVGTDQGLFMYDADQQADPSLGFTQVKVARNDGTDLADYLMAGVNITCIAIDGANRKWLGTDGNGVYLISADNSEQLLHFTAENSPLLSSNIEGIAIDDQTGRVYFGTDQGLCSYVSDATAAVDEMTKDGVYAYPNPVAPDYQGVITILGLSMNADVKIVSTSGKLVAQGRSNGGTFTWNGRDRQGRRVASGIYMVCTATSDGDSGTVCKIAIVN